MVHPHSGKEGPVAETEAANQGSFFHRFVDLVQKPKWLLSTSHLQLSETTRMAVVLISVQNGVDRGCSEEW